MKICDKCGGEVGQGANFCGSCGASSAKSSDSESNRSTMDRVIGAIAAHGESEGALYNISTAQNSENYSRTASQNHGSGFSIRFSALCLFLILTLLSWSEYNKFALAECKSKAIENNFIHKVLEIRAWHFKCEYLSRDLRNTESMERPEWVTEWSFDL